MKGKRKNFSPVGIVRDNSVPVLFIIICLIMIPLSGFSPSYVLNEVMTRLGRNSFMILSLLIPIMAGMGLNFGMTLGAMAGEIGLILVADWQIWGIPGLILAAIISIPISVLLGLMCGKILNRAKGREMITSYFIAFFMGGVYQLVVLYMMGPIIPIAHNSLKLPRGYGIRGKKSRPPAPSGSMPTARSAWRAVWVSQTRKSSPPRRKKHWSWAFPMSAPWTALWSVPRTTAQRSSPKRN